VDQLGIPSQTNFFTALLRSAQRRPGEMPWSRPVSPPFNFLLLPVIASTVGKRDELAALHSITSSARATSVGGNSRPSALAVLRLMTSSYLFGA
jgi:hypothetical protein